MKKIDWRHLSEKEQKEAMAMLIKFNRNRLRHDRIKGGCYSRAWKNIQKYHKKGYQVRMGIGWLDRKWRKRYHAWCEYKDGDKWIMVDRGLGRGYTLGDCDSLYILDYYTEIYLRAV